MEIHLTVCREFEAILLLENLGEIMTTSFCWQMKNVSKDKRKYNIVKKIYPGFQTFGDKKICWGPFWIKKKRGEKCRSCWSERKVGLNSECGNFRHASGKQGSGWPSKKRLKSFWPSRDQFSAWRQLNGTFWPRRGYILLLDSQWPCHTYHVLFKKVLRNIGHSHSQA